MSFRNQEINRLFDELENRDSEYRGHLVRDGIIDEHTYNFQNIKVLFVCKEPNNPKQQKGDFRKWWKRELKHLFSHRIGTWAYGILEDFPPLDSITRKIKFDSLSRIAFINIKKLGGTSKSSELEILNHAKRNQDILQKQLKIINPDIIVLGISWWSNVRDILFEGFEHKIITDYVHQYDNKLIINFYHPSTPSKSNKFLYEELRKLIESSNNKI